MLNIPEKGQLVEQRHTDPELKEELEVPLLMLEKGNEEKGKVARHMRNLEKALELVKVHPEKVATHSLMKEQELKER